MKLLNPTKYPPDNELGCVVGPGGVDDSALVVRLAQWLEGVLVHEDAMPPDVGLVRVQC